MHYGLFAILATLVGMASIVVFQSVRPPPEQRAQQQASRSVKDFLARNGILVPLRQDLGSAHWPVCAENVLARRFFDQGLRWLVAYNFRMALQSFLQAETLDPRCAMCAWGEATSRGQNLNEFLDASPDNVARAYRAIHRAVALNAAFVPSSPAERSARLLERDFLRAAVQRFGPTPQDMELTPERRQRLNEKYADAMAELADEQYSDNTWILFFAADAQMNTSPWNYFEEMLPGGRGKTFRQPRIAKAVEYVKRILSEEPMHPGALHLTIHLFEAAADPTPAIEAAKKLDGLVPGSEHLLHMPSHGYIRAGMLADAARVNREAAKVPLEEHAYPEHNMEFIVYSLNAMGDATAQVAAWKVHEISEGLLATGKDGYEAIFPYERFVVAPLYTCVVFGNWSCVRAYPKPPERRVFARAFYHWAMGHLAVAEEKSHANATRQLEMVRQIKTELESEENVKRYTATLYPVANIVTTLECYLESAAAKLAGGNRDSIVTPLRRAAAIEWYYDEPPSMFFPAEIVLGCALKGSERRHILEEALNYHVKNQWALDCLAQENKGTFV